jgi:hypothetical protein
MDPKTSGVKGDKRDLQGEGNYDATHRYNDGVAKSVEQGTAEELAEKAKKALEGAEAEGLRHAEERAKHGLKDDSSKK